MEPGAVTGAADAAPTGERLEDMGEHALRGGGAPVRLFAS